VPGEALLERDGELGVLAAAQRAVTAAAADVRRERWDLIDAQVKQARRDRQGRNASDGLPKIIVGARKRQGHESAGRSRELHAERLQAARGRLEEAEQAVRDDPEIRVDLPGTAVPVGRTVLAVTGLAAARWHPAAAMAATGALGRRRYRSSSCAVWSGSRSPARTARARPPCCAPSRARRRRPASRSAWARRSATCRSGSTSSTIRSPWSTTCERRRRPRR